MPSTRPKTQTDVSGWHREQIKAAVRMSGTTLRELSVRHGYTHQAACIALRRPWPKLERIIAKRIGVKPWVLWPERYTTGRHPRPLAQSKGVA